MEPRHLVLAALAVANVPLYLLLARLLFGKRGAEGSLSVDDLVDTRARHDTGSSRKLVLLLAAAAILVLIEYSLALSLFPSLRPLPKVLP